MFFLLGQTQTPVLIIFGKEGATHFCGQGISEQEGPSMVINGSNGTLHVRSTTVETGWEVHMGPSLCSLQAAEEKSGSV